MALITSWLENDEWTHRDTDCEAADAAFYDAHVQEWTLEQQRDAAIAERARYGDMMTARLVTVEAERDAARALALRMRDERDEYAAAHEQLPCGHPAAFIAAPAGCDPRCELCAVRAERDALREQLKDREQDLAHEYKRANEACDELVSVRAEVEMLRDGWAATIAQDVEAERDALRIALREVKGLLPLVFESSATYDKIMALLDK